MNTQILIIILAVLDLILFFLVFKLHSRLRKLFRGRKGRDLEEIIISLRNELDQMEKEFVKGEARDRDMDARLKKSVSGVSMIRFSPFQGEGGNQSFALAMLDEENDGVVISSLYARERMSVFAKPIKNGVSEFELSAEEKKVLADAQK